MEMQNECHCIIERLNHVMKKYISIIYANKSIIKIFNMLFDNDKKVTNELINNKELYKN